MKKIAHLTSVHKRNDTRIFLKECTSLAANGFSVSLVVADGQGDDKCNDVNIYDVGPSRGRLDRILNAPRRVFNKAVELDAQVYHIHDPELMPIALKLKKLGKKVIYDIHEMTRLQIMSKEWIPVFFRSLLKIIFSKYEDFACRKLDYLVVPQEEMKVYFSKLTKCQTIFNYPEADYNIKGVERNRYNIIYSGTLGVDRGLFNYINLIENLVKIDSRYKLILACNIDDELKEAVDQSSAKNSIQIVGFLNFDDLLKKYHSSTFGLILFNNVGQYYMTNALKLFEYMRSGLVVIMPDFGDWLNFNKVNNAGFNVDVKNGSEIASLICGINDSVISEASTHNIELSNKKFSWGSESLKLTEIYDSLVSDKNA